jgi:branched-chain amino acid aminotransferase
MQLEVNIPKNIPENKELFEYPLQLYEVIRVIDGIPLFFEDHLERLNNSANLTGIDNLPSQESIEKKIFKLITDENRKIGNIKLTFTITRLHQQPKCELDFIPHFYPSEEKYSKGVKIGLLVAERLNPQAKLQNLVIRNKANQLMSKENLFEVLLVDHAGNITEGSRSNVFFVINNQVYTSPDEKVLNGITRRKILKLCMDNNIPFIKKDLPVINIRQFKGAFLTGSSLKVLPISTIGDIHYKPELQIIKRIIKLYNLEINQYTKEKLKRL